jgi:hypothetical protein
MDHAATKVIRALDAGEIPPILLKGASTARWLYNTDDARIYADCDLFVSSARFRSAVEILESLGFQPELDELEMPPWWREHALALVRQEDGTVIDLHRTLPGAHVADEQQWRTLSDATETIRLGDTAVRVLSEPGRGLHAALHTAQHGGSARDLDVLARAIERMDDDAWRVAAGLASELQATAAFQRGLCFVPAGAALAQRIGLDAGNVVDVELRATRSPEALTIARLVDTRGMRPRLSIVRHKLMPPPSFMRKWSPLARRGRLGLALAYIWRPLWVISRLPHAVSAWGRVRRS